MFVKPNSNASWYAACAFALPGFNLSKLDMSKPSTKASFNNLGFVNPSNKTPLAPAKAPALIKLRICVGIDKTVLANCEIAFGNNKRFL